MSSKKRFEQIETGAKVDENPEQGKRKFFRRKLELRGVEREAPLPPPLKSQPPKPLPERSHVEIEKVAPEVKLAGQSRQAARAQANQAKAKQILADMEAKRMERLHRAENRAAGARAKIVTIGMGLVAFVVLGTFLLPVLMRNRTLAWILFSLVMTAVSQLNNSRRY